MPAPVFAFLAFTSGSYEGAIIRDMRLANELHRRGWRVVVYWMMERNPELVDEGIPQRMLCGGLRYMFEKPSGVMDKLGRGARLWPAPRRRRFMQQHPDFVRRLMSHFARVISLPGTGDARVAERLARWCRRDGVTHLLPTFAMICPIALEARRRGGGFEYLVTFQGEEIFANYAQMVGQLENYYQRLREVVAGSPWPAVAVSRDYMGRLHEEMGIEPQKLRAIYPGIELPAADRPRPAFETIWSKLPGLRRDIPIVTYFGRQDSEKGIDLLLYAARMLQQRGVKMQLVACGGSSFGLRYREVCEQIAAHLRLEVYWKRRLPDEVRDALYAHSRCVVYPSIHREPFGMVAAEAMSHGTPALVPDTGGITEVVNVDGRRGGLTFKSWDTADLANQLQRLLEDEALHRELSASARPLAEQFSVGRMTDRVLEHLGFPPRP